MGLGEVCATENAAVVAAAFAYHCAGALDLAEPLYRQVLDRDGDDLNALHMLGALLSKRGQGVESVSLLERAEGQIGSRDKPAAQHGALFYNLGLAQKSVGRSSEAVESFRKGLALTPEDAPLHANLAGEIGLLDFLAGRFEQARDSFEVVVTANADNAQSWFMLGCSHNALSAAGQAEAAYRRCLACRPDFVAALFRLGLLLRDDRQQPVEAIALMRRAAALAPDDFDLQQALGESYRRVNCTVLALEAFQRAVEIAPDSAAAQFNLGSTLVEAGRNEEALGPLRRVIGLGAPAALIQPATLLLGDALQSAGRIGDAAQAFRDAAGIDPVALLRPAPAGAPHVLFLFAPGLYNTPYRYLTEGETYGASLLLLVPGLAYDIDALRTRGTIVVNLVSDADRDREILTKAAALVDRLGKPVINHPDKIMPTDRQLMAALLAAIPGCRAARTVRHQGHAVLAADFAPPPLPCLVRRAGFHNGDEFEKVATADKLLRFVARNPGEDYYVIDYLDYRSPDGFFRKYRFFFVGGAIFPYHLAIGTDWKLHHVKTDMADQPWMQQEEAAFLDAPGRVFNTAQMASLHAVREALGLDFAGIDCSLAADGAVVVFEANATMLVHGDLTNFPYRERHVLRIKAAFTAALEA